MPHVKYTQMDNVLLYKASSWIKKLSILAAVVIVGLTFSLQETRVVFSLG